MLSRRSSFKNQTCPIQPQPQPQPQPNPPLTHRTNRVGHQQHGLDLQPLPTSQSTKFSERTYSIGHQKYGHDYGLGELHPFTGTISTKVTQRTNSIGHHDYGLNGHHPLAHTQSTNVAQRTNSVGHQEYGHDLQPLPHTQPTQLMQRTNSVGPQGDCHGTQSGKVTQRTNSVGHKDYGHGLQPLFQAEPTKLTQKTNGFGHDQQPSPHIQLTKVTQRTNSVGQHEYEHGLQLEIPKKPAPKIEFPVSPELDLIVVGEGITNANHPQHRMIHVNIPNLFTCMGCKEYGAGPRFTCQQCNFELHDFCALAPPVLKAHPLHSQHQLLFNPKPGKGGILRSKCDVCGKPAKGYLFHCSACSYQLHPSCAMLSAKMKFPTHPHPLLILPASTNSILGGDPRDLPCAECKRKRSGQVYRCTVCDYCLHAVCAKNMVNGLHANGVKGLDKPSVLGVAAKIATHVVVGFMGGLVEGLGEGLGEAITQNFVKGRCSSARKLLYPGN